MYHLLPMSGAGRRTLSGPQVLVGATLGGIGAVISDFMDNLGSRLFPLERADNFLLFFDFFIQKIAKIAKRLSVDSVDVGGSSFQLWFATSPPD